MRDMTKRLSMEFPRKISVENEKYGFLLGNVKTRSSGLQLILDRLTKIQTSHRRQASCQTSIELGRHLGLDPLFTHLKSKSKELSYVKKQNEILKRQKEELELKLLGSSGAEAIAEKRKQVEQFRTEIKGVQDDNELLLKKRESIERQCLELQRVTSTQLNNNTEALQQQIAEAERLYAQAEDENVKLFKNTAEFRRRKTALEDENKQLHDSIRLLSKQAKETDLLSRIKICEEKLQIQQAEISQRQSRLAELEAVNSRLRTEFQEHSRAIKDGKEKVRELERKKEESKHMRERSEEIHTVQEEENATLKQLTERMNETLRKLGAESTVDRRQAVFKECAQFVELYRDELQEANKKVEVIKERQAKFCAKLRSISDMMKGGLEKRKVGSTVDGRGRVMSTSELGIIRTGSDVQKVSQFHRSEVESQTDEEAMQRYFVNTLRFI